jgi:hypothetical protein
MQCGRAGLHPDTRGTRGETASRNKFGCRKGLSRRPNYRQNSRSRRTSSNVVGVALAVELLRARPSMVRPAILNVAAADLASSGSQKAFRGGLPCVFVDLIRLALRFGDRRLVGTRHYSSTKTKRPPSGWRAYSFPNDISRQSQRSLVTVLDSSGPSLRTVFESQPPRPVVSPSRLSTRSRPSTPTPGAGGGTVIAGRSSMTLLS